MSIESTDKMPVRFFGKKSDGSPCLIYDWFLSKEIRDAKNYVLDQLSDSMAGVKKLYIGTALPENAPPQSIFLKTTENPTENPASIADLVYTPYYVNYNGGIRKLVLATE